jgi:hypothetical protein
LLLPFRARVFQSCIERPRGGALPGPFDSQDGCRRRLAPRMQAWWSLREGWVLRQPSEALGNPSPSILETACVSGEVEPP